MYCAVALPESVHVLQNGLHLEEAPEIAIPDRALLVDEACPSGMIHHPLGTAWWAGSWSASYSRTIMRAGLRKAGWVVLHIF